LRHGTAKSNRSCEKQFLWLWQNGSIQKKEGGKMGRNVKDGVVNDYQLALLSKSVFDIGPRTRFLFLMFGAIGIALAFMESLVGRQPQTVPLDKIIHFSGYFILSATFVLALRPRWVVPSLIGLVAIGVAIEFLQRHTGRQFDVADMVADAIGVAAGGTVGLAVRGIYAFIRKELAARGVRHRLYRFGQGEVLIREGDPIDRLFVVKSGRVRALREVNGREGPLGTLGQVRCWACWGWRKAGRSMPPWLPPSQPRSIK
jgi:hypothetical protein